MSPILKAFLKAGWIQVGEGIPVFFKHDPKNNEYPFHLIFTEDSWAYFDLYDKWVKEGKITEDKIDEILVENLVKNAFDHTYATNIAFPTALLNHIYYHYKYNSFGSDPSKLELNKQKALEYEEIGNYLLEKIKKGN